MWKTCVQSLSWEDPLEEGLATHYSILVWKTPMDRGAWWASVHGVAKSQTWLTNSAQHSACARTHTPKKKKKKERKSTTYPQNYYFLTWESLQLDLQRTSSNCEHKQKETSLVFYKENVKKTLRHLKNYFSCWQTQADPITYKCKRVSQNKGFPFCLIPFLVRMTYALPHACCFLILLQRWISFPKNFLFKNFQTNSIGTYFTLTKQWDHVCKSSNAWNKEPAITMNCMLIQTKCTVKSIFHSEDWLILWQYAHF